MTEQPNLIFIFSDQHRGDTLGCNGHPVVITPNLDELASRSVNFTHCCTNSPLCMPARTSMMTGQYVCEHGIWTNNNEANPLSPSHVRNIRDTGYHTALIGKSHLYIHGQKGKEWTHTKEREGDLKNWGFLDMDELTGPLATIRHDSSYTDYLKQKGLLKTHRKYMLDYWKGWVNGTAHHWGLSPCPLPKEDHLDSYTGRRVVKWINEYKEKKPFYLQILFPGPHDPFDSPQFYRDMYNPDEMPLGILKSPEPPIPPYSKMVLRWSGIKDMTPEECRKLRTIYYAKITLIDDYIGRIIKAVEEKGLAENTWIIYNSDHGEMLGDHMMSHKIVFYESALRIPLIIKPPGGIKGWKCQGLTDHLDITATLLEIAGVRRLEGSYGTSLIPTISNGPKDPNSDTINDYIFSEVYGYTMIRNDRYKLTVKSDTQKPVELFDLKNDPNELSNIVKKPESSSIIQDLLDKKMKPFLSRVDLEKYRNMVT